jgi:DNA-binding NtrC family response regulator/tetratricopeptide (TPR) repeat protein
MMAHSDAAANYQSGFYGRAREGFESTRRRRALTLDEEVLYAELLSLTGSVQAAIDSARTLRNDRRLSNLHKCRLADVVGLSLFRMGAITAAAHEYRQAIDLAERASEGYEECRLRIHLFRNEVRWCGPQKVLGDVSQVRRKTLIAARPELSAKFHLGLADLASKLALLPRARKHLDTARALLPRIEDQAIHADVLLGDVVLTALESDVVAALNHASELIPIAEKTGSESLKFGAVSNLAHLLVLQHRFDEAIVFLDSAIKTRGYGGGSQIALIDTLILLHLSRGSYEKARFELDAIAGLLDQSDGSNSWLGLTHLVHRVRWHFLVGQAEQGLSVALDAIPRIENISGTSVLARMKLLAAEGYGRTGRVDDGITLAGAALKGDPDPPLELVAEFHRVTGRLYASDDEVTARDHFDRASRIFDNLGNLAAKAEVARDAHETLSQSSPGVSQATAEVNQSVSVLLSQQIASLGNLASRPKLLAEEVCALLARTGATEHTEILESPAGTEGKQGMAQKSAATGETVTLNIGTHRGRTWEIKAVPKHSRWAKSTLMAIEQLIANASTVASARQQHRENAALWPERTAEDEFGLVCASERMLDLVKTVQRFGATGLAILVTGETGVGKELFARALHRASSRKDKTFLPFNCATVPKDMLDSQLFGHRKGAFTGAHEVGIGVIRAADGGTLFLDEIGEMSIEAQPKLLRFLESGEIHPLGEPKPVHVDVRIVAATNASLDQLVSDGKFREDLFYRLNVLPIHIPALRERREEVPALVEHFVEKFGREMQKPMIRVADETLEYLLLYRWPGNVRQLANEIRRMVALAEPGAMLTPAHLSKEITSTRRTVAVEPSEFVMRLDQPLADATDQLERAAIERALAASNGNNDQAAKLLGLSRKGLYLKRQRLGMK